MKKLTKKIHFIVEKTTTGYSAYAKDYDVFTTGEHLSKLKNNCVEAMNFYLEEKGSFVSDESIQLQLDLKQFFQYYRVINANFLAKRIGMNPTLLSQYVRGHKIPSLKQTQKILQGIQLIGRELVDLQFFSSKSTNELSAVQEDAEIYKKKVQ